MLINIILIIISALFGIAWGFYQGMIMSQYTDKMNTGQISNLYAMGVRLHKLFGYYHRLSISLFVFYTVILSIVIIALPPILLMLGLAILAWQLAENGYNYSRYRKLFTNYENILGFKTITGIRVYILHLFRLSISILLIMAGIL